MVLFEPFACEPEVNHRQQHEDERLDETDEEYVEQLPDTQRDRTRKPWPDVRKVSQEQSDHEDHESSRQQVSEEPQREGRRLCYLFDDVQHGEERPRPDWQLERPRQMM